jgi:hypothetical protein
MVYRAAPSVAQLAHTVVAVAVAPKRVLPVVLEVKASSSLSTHQPQQELLAFPSSLSVVRL